MPCIMRDEDWKDYPRENNGMTSQEFEAVLCGIFTAKEKSAARTRINELSALLHEVDWKEVGIKRRTVETWWRRHQKQDQARRAQEAAEKERQRIKTQALSKLTEEEKKALGIRS